ncbi:hypothetical protein QWJ34_12120 [Saccharibacillus sp. CPCC 101409]|uniref:hypothetical protein n=1 Tax=Saccharibacillus sp. CPCC 101409 TaxID=3058041 RepID=UPI002673BA47|nr:hypothetical protein [Saccharibacillus sp. CPCC 101409]MDO3410508.1 hypothetical protein [Saccharibacillus sp. CPCC 101409]
MNGNPPNVPEEQDWRGELEEASERLWSTWETNDLSVAELDALEARFRQLAEQTGDARCLWLVSELQVYRMNAAKRIGEKAALQGLQLDPGQIGLHDNYAVCAGGLLPDFQKTNNRRLIDYYVEFIGRHPELLIARRILIEHLIADYRFDEAQTQIGQAGVFAGERSYVLDFYAGEILYRKGERTEAERRWAQACRTYPDSAACFYLLAEQYAKFARYEEAEEAYERSFAMQTAPRRIDALTSLLHIHEIRRDDAALLHTLDRILEVFAVDHGETEGPYIEPYLRQKERLSESRRIG